MIFDVVQLEFHQGENTIWIHAPDGTTMLRIKCTGRIVVNDHCISPVAHCDLMVVGNIDFCVPSTDAK